MNIEFLSTACEKSTFDKKPFLINAGKTFFAIVTMILFSGTPFLLKGIGRLAVNLFKHIYKVGIVIITQGFGDGVGLRFPSSSNCAASAIFSLIMN